MVSESMGHGCQFGKSSLHSSQQSMFGSSHGKHFTKILIRYSPRPKLEAYFREKKQLFRSLPPPLFGNLVQTAFIFVQNLGSFYFIRFPCCPFSPPNFSCLSWFLFSFLLDLPNPIPPYHSFLTIYFFSLYKEGQFSPFSSFYIQPLVNSVNGDLVIIALIAKRQT